MPLILSLRRNEDFYVADERVVLTRIRSKNDFDVVVESVGKEFQITDLEAVEIIPDVFVSAGDYYQTGQVRVVIEAPREIRILRGERYRENVFEGG